MSRSYKKVAGRINKCKASKRLSNKAVRSAYKFPAHKASLDSKLMATVQNGSWYKKLFQSYKICDNRYTIEYSLQRFLDWSAQHEHSRIRLTEPKWYLYKSK